MRDLFKRDKECFIFNTSSKLITRAAGAAALGGREVQNWGARTSQSLNVFLMLTPISSVSGGKANLVAFSFNEAWAQRSWPMTFGLEEARTPTVCRLFLLTCESLDLGLASWATFFVLWPP